MASAGGGIALNYGIETDVTTPLLRGFQIAGAREQQKALADQKKREQAAKIAKDQYSLDPTKVHVFFKEDADKDIGAYLTDVGLGEKDSFTLGREKTLLQQRQQDRVAASQALFDYDKDNNRVKDDVLSQAIFKGDRKLYDTRVQQLKASGDYSPAIDPLSGVIVPRVDLKDEVNKGFNFKQNTGLYVKTREENTLNGRRIHYGIDPAKKDAFVEQVLVTYGPEVVWANLMNTQTYKDEKRVIDADPSMKELTPRERAEFAMEETIFKTLAPTHYEEESRPQSININNSNSTVPPKARNIFTDSSFNLASTNKTTKATTYEDYIKDINNVVGGKIVSNAKGTAGGVELQIGGNEAERNVRLTGSDKLTFGPNGTPFNPGTNIAAKTERIILGSAYKDPDGNLIWIDKSNFDKYKDQLGTDAVQPAYLVEYSAAPDAGSIAGVSEDDYLALKDAGKAEIRGSKIYQVVSGDEYGNSTLTNRYKSFNDSYNNVIQGSFDKSGNRVKKIETNTQPLPNPTPSRGQTGKDVAVKRTGDKLTLAAWKKSNPSGTVAQYKEYLSK